jgi:hypothetical protein
MDLYVVVLRLLHIVFGVLWVGFACFVPFVLLPSLTDAGPGAAGPLMAAIQRRGLPKIMSAFAGTTILAGILLLWHVSEGFKPEYMGSRMGIALSTGALAAIVAFAIGMAVVKPAMTKAGTLSEGLASASESERGALMATIGALRSRGAAGGKWVAWLLLVAAAAMAAARYL